MSPERTLVEFNKRPLTPIEAAPFPEDPRARFEAVYGSLANSEAKCALLLITTDDPKGPSAMLREFSESVGGSWTPDVGTIADYYNTLIAGGLVTKTDKGYKTTEAGEKFGKPIAAYLFQQTYPLFSLKSLGSTALIHDSRAVINRADVLTSLSRAGKALSTSELARTLGRQPYDNLFSKHLKDLKSLGLVNYLSGEESIVYQIVNPDVKIHFRYRTSLRQRVRDTIIALGSADAGTIANQLFSEYDYETLKGFQADVSDCLTMLARAGMLQKNFEIGSYLTQIEPTRLGIFVARGIIDPIKEALTESGAPLLAAWKNIPWQVYVQEGVEKFKEGNPNLSKHTPQQSAQEILSIIRVNPGMSKAQIEKALGRNAYEALKLLRVKGEVVVTPKGNKWTYSPSPAIDSSNY